MIYNGKFIVKWEKAKKDKTDALMDSFDTMIEAKSFIKGFVAAILQFTEDGNVFKESKLLSQFKIEKINK
tara:strand:+ start:407 stop:616 length:210 start_codon:yes stop_codon:yes gene_type:complete